MSTFAPTNIGNSEPFKPFTLPRLKSALRQLKGLYKMRMYKRTQGIISLLLGCHTSTDFALAMTKTDCPDFHASRCSDGVDASTLLGGTHAPVG